MVRLKSCVVVTCGNVKSEEISLHLVPTKKSTRETWMKFICTANSKFQKWKPTQSMWVCSQHFETSCIVKYPSGKKGIRKGHYPVILEGSRVYTTSVADQTKQVSSQADATGSEREAYFELKLFQHVPKEPEPTQEEKLQNALQQKDAEINTLKCEIAYLKVDYERVVSELNAIKLAYKIATRKTKLFRSRLQRCTESRKRKIEEGRELQCELSQLKRPRLSNATQTDLIAVKPSRELGNVVLELLGRVKCGKRFSEPMREFAFNMHYLSPKAYAFLRKSFSSQLPHPRTFLNWTSHIITSPGILPASFEYIAKSNINCEAKLYSLSFDEMALRRQVTYDGKGMQGYTNYGGLSSIAHGSEYAKNALFCMITEINGSKSFPLGYILTNGLSACLLRDFIRQCLKATHDASGKVLSITFDGLSANFKAAELLGACFNVNSADFKTYIIDPSSGGKVYIFPDPSHMFKLLRNAFRAFYNLTDGNGNKVTWRHIDLLQKIQDETGLRAANRLTSRHVHFEKQKMKTKLCLQLLSNSVAVAIDLCRELTIAGFEDSSGTTKFLRISDRLFDIMNSKPLKSSRCTFAMGLVTAITSIEAIMDEVVAPSKSIRYLPTYKLSQDKLELFFGKIRLRFGCNNNPNTVQLEHCLKGMLRFHVNPSETGNCISQELDSNKIAPTRSLRGLILNEEIISAEYDDDVGDTPLAPDTIMEGFVNNVVVYIAGFVGMMISKQLTCTHCIKALIPDDLHTVHLRADYCLLIRKDNGGLFHPSESLIAVCKITEQTLRHFQNYGIEKLNGQMVVTKSVNECYERGAITSFLHFNPDWSMSNEPG